MLSLQQKLLEELLRLVWTVELALSSIRLLRTRILLLLLILEQLSYELKLVKVHLLLRLWLWLRLRLLIPEHCGSVVLLHHAVQL